MNLSALMWIEENTPDRLVLKSRAVVVILFSLAVAVAFYFAFFWIFVPDVVMPLIAKAAWTLAPEWAEASGLRNEAPSLDVVSLITLLLVVWNVRFLVSIFRSLLFDVDRSFVVDLPRKRLTVASRGLFCSPDRVFPFSDVRMSVEKSVADGEEVTRLSLTVPPLPGKAERKEIWITTFHPASVSPEVERQLAAFIARMPGSASPKTESSPYDLSTAASPSA